MSANTLKGASDEALIAEVKRRADKSSEFLEQARTTLAEKKVRPAVTDTLSGIGEPAPGGQPDAAETASDQPDLSPEQMQELLAALEHRFNNHPKHYENLEALPRLEQGVTFAEVRTCLESDPTLAKKVYAMLKRRGDPDVYSRYGKSFLFFESVQNTTPASRNCVYGKAQAAWLKANRPGEQFNGSVEEERTKMGGVSVTAEQMWYDLQKLGSFTDDSWEWTDSDDINDDSPAGGARYADRSGVKPRVFRGGAGYHDPVRGWRAVAKGSEA